MKSVDWSKQYSRRLDRMTTSAIRDILKVAQKEDIISLAGGWPEAGLFPVEQLSQVAEDVLADMAKESLQYGITDGLVPLRQEIVKLMSADGIICDVENVVITSGSQQALDLMPRIFVDEGDTVLVEEPTFLGGLQSFNAYGCKFATVPVDQDGARVDLLPEIIERTKPKFMYIIPTFQNPTGVTMSLERRQALVEIAAETGVPILEDDPYGQLRFSGKHLPSLCALDQALYPENAAQNRYVTGNTIYLSTFSKTLAPGLRLAWAICPPEIANNFVMAKQGSDLHTNGLAQTMAYEFLRRGWLPDQITRIRETYRGRCEAMCDAIDEFFPEGAHFVKPEGGLFLWVTLPDGCDTVALLQEAAKRGVAFVPGSPFYANGGGENTIRMAFASVPPDRIREGIRRLGSVLEEQLATCSIKS